MLAVGAAQASLEPRRRSLVSVTLVYDAGTVDAASAAAWLHAFRRALRDPGAQAEAEVEADTAAA